jgi:hypothetical protein
MIRTDEVEHKASNAWSDTLAQAFQFRRRPIEGQQGDRLDVSRRDAPDRELHDNPRHLSATADAVARPIQKHRLVATIIALNYRV